MSFETRLILALLVLAIPAGLLIHMMYMTHRHKQRMKAIEAYKIDDWKDKKS